MSCLLNSCNKYVYYEGPDFFYFDTSNPQNGATSISDNATITGSNALEYYIHFSSKERSEAVELSFSVTYTDGLLPGRDFRLTGESTTGKIVFYPGSNYDRPIRMEFLPHDLEKNERIILTLTSCSDPSVSLGKPGPGLYGNSLTIVKYKH